MFPNSFMSANEANMLLNALVGKPAAASAATPTHKMAIKHKAADPPAAAKRSIETDSEDEDQYEQPRRRATKRIKIVYDSDDTDGDDDTDDQGAAPPMAVKPDISAAAARSELPDMDFDKSDEEGAIMRAGPAAADAPVAVDPDIQRQFNLLDDAMTEPHKFNDWYAMHLFDGAIDDNIMEQYIPYLKSRGVCTKGIDHLA